MTPILGFMPDAELTTPGVLADCVNFVPTLTGMEGGPTAVTPSGVPALASACQGAAVVTKLDNTRRVFAGAQTAIYELSAGAWVDRTRTTGGAYTGGSESIWSITQFGDASLMANKSDTIQRSTSDAFANIATAPKAEIVFSVRNQVMALNTNDGTEKPDGWHCCAVFDDTLWTPSTTTQAASGRLVSTPGPLTAGARLGEYAIAYKSKSIYLGQYVGAPVVWDWTQVQGGNAGCVGKNALCDVDGIHFFVGEDNFWLFDGSRPVPIADGILRDFFTADCDPVAKYKIVCSYDRPTNRVFVFYPSKGSSALNSCLVYHVKSKKWGRANRSIQCALEYVSGGATFDTLTDYSATMDGLPDVGWDSPFWLSGGRAFSIFNTSNQLQSLTGVSDASSFETGDVGDDDAMLLLQGIRLRYKLAPTSATVQTRHKKNSGETYVNGPSGVLADGKFDVLITDRWHRAQVLFDGPVHVTHMKAMSKVVGRR
jgi:hypothetical protein